MNLQMFVTIFVDFNCFVFQFLYFKQNSMVMEKLQRDLNQLVLRNYHGVLTKGNY